MAGTLAITGQAQGGPEAKPVPRADCGKGSRPETDIQGRVPARDYANGRVDRGYRCNARAVSKVGRSGGFKVHRYVDSKGQTCAFYDSTLVFPRDVLYNLTSGLAGCSMIATGLRLIDISDVDRPREVAYFNQPQRPGSRPTFPDVAGAYAMSAPAWDKKNGSVWYTDANSGFYNVKLTNGVADLLR